MSIIIRPAELADIPAIAQIYATAVRTGTASFELEPPDAAEMARRQRVLLEGGYPYLVAELQNEVVGYAYAGPYHTRPAYRWTVEDSIYVAPERHRCGIGRTLLGRLIEACETRGFRQLIAVIGDPQQGASMALHRAAGFRLVGTFTAIGFKFGRWLDTVQMQRQLGSGASTAP